MTVADESADEAYEDTVVTNAPTAMGPRTAQGAPRARPLGSPVAPSERAAAPGPLAPGAEVDGFTVLAPIGRGGMGRVYLARDRKLGRLVALKVIRRSALADEDLRARFLLEARLTARFNHPHIVTIHSVGEHEGQPYLALEYLEGETLAARRRAGPLRPRQALRIGLAIAEALTEAHRKGVLHRDLKPDNVFLPTDGRVRVLDFGLAVAPQHGAPATGGRPASSDEPEHSGSGAEIDDERPTIPFSRDDADAARLVGTPLYIAPELWLGGPATAASDIWSLGIILHEMLAGAHPWRARTLDELRLVACAEAEVPRIDRPSVPDSAAALTACCLDKDPDRRPGAWEVAAALRAIVTRRARPRRSRLSSAPFLLRSGRLGSPGSRRSQALA